MLDFTASADSKHISTKGAQEVADLKDFFSANGSGLDGAVSARVQPSQGFGTDDVWKGYSDLLRDSKHR